jgi:hypothetical protein
MRQRLPSYLATTLDDERKLALLETGEIAGKSLQSPQTSENTTDRPGDVMAESTAAMALPATSERRLSRP